MANKRQLKREIRSLAAVLHPRMVEFFDSWIVIGVRAGDNHQALTMTVPPKDRNAQAITDRLENEILSVAHEICLRRQASKTAKAK